jgi:putative ABC transport system ATP-binding protein
MTDPTSAKAQTHSLHHTAAHISPTLRILSLLQSQRNDLWVVLIYAMGIGVLSLVVPIATASLVNTISFGVVLQPLVVLTFLVFVGLAFKGLMQGMQFWVVEILQRRVFVQVALDLSRSLPHVRAVEFDRAHGPELVNRFFDVLTVQKTVATLLLDGLTVFLQAAIGTLLLAFYHPVLLAFDVVLVLCMAIVFFPLGRGAIETSIKESKAKYAVAAWLEEIARLTDTFRGDSAGDFASHRADMLATKYLRARAKHFRIVMRQHVGSLAFRALLSSALLGIGGWLVISRSLTIGQLAAAELVVGAVVAGMAKFAKQLESWYDLVTAVDKLGHLSDLPKERENGEAVSLGSTQGICVELQDVSFGYVAESPVLTKLSLTLKPGSCVAVLGRSGNGKSALADVLLGLREPTRGTMRVEGVDVRELSLDSLRNVIALVRGVDIFDGTIAENVSVGRPGLETHHIRNALTALHMDKDIAALSEGIHSELAASGAPLSTAQARLLMFARAIAAAPKLIVVDGALDAFDTETAREIMSALTISGAPWTVLILTVREEFARACKEIWHLRDGTLVRADSEEN